MDSPLQGESSRPLSIAVVHAHRLTRDVIAKTLASKLSADAVTFGCLEDLLRSSMRYDVFVVFSEFGPGKMEQAYGCKWIRDLKPQAHVFAMLQRRHFERRGTPSSSDRTIFCIADDLNGLALQIKRRVEETAAQRSSA
ncbi:MAG: hypothetical protein M1482_08855 [Chloroflexi bacterium]|nr:hypothetical protein [Chloroflexota bacterium]